MARQPRQQQETSLFSIKQQSKQVLFQDKQDKLVVRDILEKSKHKYGFDIYAFCLLDDDAFWIILDAKKRSISRIMQSICISYSLYKEEDHQLFHTRYQSKPLYSSQQLKNELDSLKEDKRYEMGSYCYINPMTLKPFEFVSDVKDSIEVQTSFAKRLSDQQALDVFEKYGANLVVELEERNELIRKLYAKYNVSQKQLANYFGVSSSMISKIVNV